MLFDDKIDSVVDYFLNRLKVKKFTDNYIYVNGKRVAKAKFFKCCLTPKTLEKFELLGLMTKDEETQTEFANEVVASIVESLEEEAKVIVPKGSLPRTDGRWSKYTPVIDLRTSDTILYDNTRNRVSNVCFKTWEQCVTPDEQKAILATRRVAVFEYNPYSLRPHNMVEFEGEERLQINIHIPPNWRLEEPLPEAKCPELIEKLLKHLFPDEKCLEYVKNWMYLSLVERNESYLVLNGTKGIGKGVFCSLLDALVGQENFVEAPDSLLSSHFNSALDRNRIVLFDEFMVEKKQHNKLKRYINRFQNIERKGFDADKSKEIFNSYIISNNDVADMFLESNDRRFSVPDITERPLLEVMSMEEVDSLVLGMKEDEDLIRQFGNWVLHSCASENFDKVSIWKGERFFRLVYSSLYMWQKFLVDTVLEGKESFLSLEGLSKGYRKSARDSGAGRSAFPRHIEKIEDFLKNYRQKGINVLGELVVEEDGGVGVAVNPKFINEEVNLDDL